VNFTCFLVVSCGIKNINDFSISANVIQVEYTFQVI